MSLCLSVTILRSYKTECPNECRQQRKHHEPITEAQQSRDMRNKDLLLNRIASINYSTNLKKTNCKL